MSDWLWIVLSIALLAVGAMVGWTVCATLAEKREWRLIDEIDAAVFQRDVARGELAARKGGSDA